MWWEQTILATTTVRKGTSSMTITSWWIWKQHKAAIFYHEQPNIAGLLDAIKAEAELWAQAGAKVWQRYIRRNLAHRYNIVILGCGLSLGLYTTLSLSMH